MATILVLGSGRIGTLIAHQLASTKDYTVIIADQQHHNSGDLPYQLETFDACDQTALVACIKTHTVQAIVSCLPYHCNQIVASMAKEHHLHYFDLTEDVSTTTHIKKIAHKATTAFVPQCGVAPGFVNIVAHDMMKNFTHIESAILSVGALPQHSNHPLRYALTWSTEGLVNEYINPCLAIESGELTTVPALTGLQALTINGTQYEIFNTSGGIGSLVESYSGQIDNLHYKTLRYPGHCQDMRFLLEDLGLANNRPLMTELLEHTLPHTADDIVTVFIHIIGDHSTGPAEQYYTHQYYPSRVAEQHWTAIQMTTASAMTAIVDTVLSRPEHYKGFIKQEDFALSDILNNRFGCYYQPSEEVTYAFTS